MLQRAGQLQGCTNSNHQTSTELGGLWHLAVRCGMGGFGWGAQIATKGSLHIQDVQNLVQKDATGVNLLEVALRSNGLWNRHTNP